MPFAPVKLALDLPALETRLLEQWRREGLFHESLHQRDGAPEWVFYEGPPTANGRPATHHVWARVFKDLYPRFHTMRGRFVTRKGGWDCHGLPVELEVEKELGFSSKHQIEEYGIEAFNQRCRESVHRYVEDWSKLTERIGMWLDTDDAYWTLSNSYIESVWWLFKQLWDKELIYEGLKVVPYCGRCGTALSSHEVAQGYRDITEDSVYVRFPIVDADAPESVRDSDLLVWTTTPWTLVSNVAAAIGEDIEYVRVGHGKRDLIVARERVAAVLGDDAEVIAPVAAADLVGRHYRRPFDLLPIDDDANVVVAADFVNVDDGSGIVHLAPAFGEIDREVSQAAGLPVLNPVGPDARFDASAGPYVGKFVKDADSELIADLRRRDLVVTVEAYTHSYPHCWRCDTPLIYWAKPTWFANTSSQRDALLRENETIGWHPEHIKHGRFGDWLENNVDWALSRDRYWGTPLPVWRCDDCAAERCIGSVSELGDAAGRDLTELDLHRPYLDDVTIPCSDCSGTARRVEPVIDAWFDSGSMPSAQWHYPFAGDDAFAARFPADFICEAIDQTRGWFYSLLAVNTLVFGRSPYRNVVCLAHIVDRDGQKMSKSHGNTLDAWTILDERGADALRWNFLSAGSPWTPKRVFEENIDETTRRFLLTLWNTYYFAVNYANLDGWQPRPTTPSDHFLDRWVRSRLHSTALEVTDGLEAFDALRAAQALDSFVDDLSNWYVRRSRPRFWNADDARAHATLHECLVVVARLLAPFCPFIADEIHRNLSPDRSSVHLADWPTVDGDAIDRALEGEIARARTLVRLGLAARNDAKLKVRQPLRRALVVIGGDVSDDVLADDLDALNVKTVERVEDLEGLLEFSVVPNFRTLGPRIGNQVPAVKAALAAVDGAKIRRALAEQGSFDLTLPDGATVTLEPTDVDVRAQAHSELAMAQEDRAAVALDTALDDELRLEGLARELARAINDLRKDMDLALSDRISVVVRAAGPAADAARIHGEWIAGEVLATSWEVAGAGGDGFREVNLDGMTVGVRLARNVD